MRHLKNSLNSIQFNRYDIAILSLITIGVILWHRGWHDMHAQLHSHLPNITSTTKALAYDLLRTNMRLLIGLFWSFVFSFVAAIWAAKSKQAAFFILPFINFMESVPLVGFMSLSILFFMQLYPHSVMGLECAAIFGVFTGQAWNMALSLYQSMMIIPEDLRTIAQVFRLSAWSRFWIIELPYALPALLWNTMMSQSAAWFALVGTETIAMGAKNYALPGIGSYIQIALDQANLKSIVLAVTAIAINIIVFDQLIFRPLVRWSEKFKFERIQTRKKKQSWAYNVYKKTYAGAALYHLINKYYVHCRYRFIQITTTHSVSIALPWMLRVNKACWILWYVFLSYIFIRYGMLWLLSLTQLPIMHMLYLMLLTSARVALAVILSVVFFLPLGIWIGLNPKLTRLVQPIIQIMAALPPDLLYPIMAVFLINFHQGLGWWTVPLIMIGTQWYILFNVIAGVSTIPQDLLDVGAVFSLRGIRYWQKLIVPAIFPSVVTGIISAAGGAWNADITAELIQWGGHTLSTHGLGAFIATATTLNHPSQEALGCILMSALVALCVIFIWRPLYQLAEHRYKIN